MKKTLFNASLVLLSCLSIISFSSCEKEEKIEPIKSNPPEISSVVPKNTITEELMNHSLKIGTDFLVNNQNSSGSFNYEYNWKRKNLSREDNQVRQAGALWGLSLTYLYNQSEDVQKAIEKAIAFFFKNSKLTSNATGRYIVYPEDSSGKTGTGAIVALGYIEYLRVAKPYLKPKEYDTHMTHLKQYLKHLSTLVDSTSLFYSNYTFVDGTGYGKSSPYSDGEALLAFIKAEKYLNITEYRDITLKGIDSGYQNHIVEALKKDPDSNTTKGFYQWSSMCFYELATSGWKDTEKYGRYPIDLANWMIDVHRTLYRTRNTAYAYEGIIHAYELARMKDDRINAQKFLKVINKGMYKLTSWQVGSTVPCRYIRRGYKTYDKLAHGGVQNHRKEDGLRIDVTQHQMYAVNLALKFVFDAYNKPETPVTDTIKTTIQ